MLNAVHSFESLQSFIKSLKKYVGIQTIHAYHRASYQSAFDALETNPIGTDLSIREIIHAQEINRERKKSTKCRGQ